MYVHVHIPVLPNEVIAYLKPKKGDVMIDATLGLGGHTQLLLEKGCTVYGLDVDPRNLAEARISLGKYIVANTEKKSQLHLYNENFENIEEIAAKIKKQEGALHGILFDLGISSAHVDDPTRGFSFLHNGPLDMRLDPSQKLTAADIVNTFSVEDLSQILTEYGEEHYARRIAYNIDEYRKSKLFNTTGELADFIAGVVHSRNAYYAKRTIIKGIWPTHEQERVHAWALHQRRHPATRTFQALRMAVNREKEVLIRALHAALRVIDLHGRIAVISFHSIEDRVVKNIFKEHVLSKQYALVNKKPLLPTSEEVMQNPRSRSAKLRVIERIV